jgi:hypothetical protein
MTMTLKKRLILGFTSNLMLLPVYLGIFIWSTVSAVDSVIISDALRGQAHRASDVLRLGRQLADPAAACCSPAACIPVMCARRSSVWNRTASTCAAACVAKVGWMPSGCASFSMRSTDSQGERT